MYDKLPSIDSFMLKTVEVPLSGHPDKICDQIVDSILDEYLKRDPKSAVDIQALGSHGILMIAGTADSKADFDVATIASGVYKQIGFEDEIEPFVNIERPSDGVSRAMVGGGARGTSIVYGYATKETREYLPRAVVYANAIARRLDDLRRLDDQFPFLLPDGKVQIAMDGKNVIAVSVSVQHDQGVEISHVQSLIVDHGIMPIIGEQSGVKLFVNSGGKFIDGGFSACGGASGRKELTDTYGGLLPHGGASFTGKDPLQPARCGQYMARFVAKNLVARGVSGNVLINAGYTIGHQEPIFLRAVTGSGEDISKQVKEEFDFRPEAIVERLDLRRPIFGRIASYGQFGREGVPWEDLISDK